MVSSFLNIVCTYVGILLNGLHRKVRVPDLVLTDTMVRAPEYVLIDTSHLAEKRGALVRSIITPNGIVIKATSLDELLCKKAPSSPDCNENLL